MAVMTPPICPGAQAPARILTVPGIGNSGTGHWQTLWERALPGCRRVALGRWDDPLLSIWVKRIDDAVWRRPGPVILAAHGLGCIAVAHWAERHGEAAADGLTGALLVAPSDVERRRAHRRHAAVRPLRPHSACPAAVSLHRRRQHQRSLCEDRPGSRPGGRLGQRLHRCGHARPSERGVRPRRLGIRSGPSGGAAYRHLRGAPGPGELPQHPAVRYPPPRRPAALTAPQAVCRDTAAAAASLAAASASVVRSRMRAVAS